MSFLYLPGSFQLPFPKFPVKIRAIYVNFWGAKGTNDLLRALARGISDNRRIMEHIKDVAKRIEGVSIGLEDISISVAKKPMATLRDFLEAIGNQKGMYVIELDEVQELATISGPLLTVLANVFNTYPNVIFVFTGSKFGLMKTLLEPGSSSPLYGRSPARLYLQSFERDMAIQFLRRGFNEHGLYVAEKTLEEAVERLGGTPGWLTLYGNNVAIRKLSHKKALEETIAEGAKIVRNELEHFLEGKNRQAYIAALRTIATTAHWSEIMGAVSIALALPINDATILRIIENLRAAMLIQKAEISIALVIQYLEFFY